MKSSATPLLSEIVLFLEQTGIPQTTFGSRAIGDPNLMRNLRAGRELRSGTAKRVRDFIVANRKTRRAA